VAAPDSSPVGSARLPAQKFIVECKLVRGSRTARLHGPLAKLADGLLWARLVLRDTLHAAQVPSAAELRGPVLRTECGREMPAFPIGSSFTA